MQLHAHNRAGWSDQFVQPRCVPLGCAAPSLHHSVKEDACYHRLVKHPEKFLADIKRPQSPQEVQPALALPVQAADVSFSVKFVVQPHAEALVGVHDSTSTPWIRTGHALCLDFPKSMTSSFVLEMLVLQVVCVAPGSEVPHQALILLFSVITDGHNNGYVVGKLMDLTQLRVTAEVWEVHREKRRGASTVPWGTPVLLITVSDMVSLSLTYFGLLVR